MDFLGSPDLRRSRTVRGSGMYNPRMRRVGRKRRSRDREVPACVCRKRHRDLRESDTIALVAVHIHLGDQGWKGLSNPRRLSG